MLGDVTGVMECGQLHGEPLERAVQKHVVTGREGLLGVMMLRLVHRKGASAGANLRQGCA